MYENKIFKDTIQTGTASIHYVFELSSANSKNIQKSTKDTIDQNTKYYIKKINTCLPDDAKNLHTKYVSTVFNFLCKCIIYDDIYI